jgi:hypothetical protein
VLIDLNVGRDGPDGTNVFNGEGDGQSDLFILPLAGLTFLAYYAASYVIRRQAM